MAVFSNSWHPPPNAVKSFIVYVWSLWGANNLYHIWKLLYSVASPIFLVIFSASLTGSDDFVLSDSLDGNGALFAYVLCDIPVLRTSKILIFGWKIASDAGLQS